MRAAISIVMATAALLAGCRQIAGIGDLSFDLVGSGGGEDCSDGIDDDGDGLADCADPDCASEGYACVAAPPPGWSGPAILYEGPPAAEPSCAGAFPVVAYQGVADLDAPPAECGECSCGAPEASCAPGLLRGFEKATCVGSWSEVEVVEGQCSAVSGMFAGFKQSPAIGAAGPCAPSGGAPSLPPVKRTVVGLLCAAEREGIGCEGGEVCAARPAPPFAPARCVHRAGDHDCPSAYPARFALGDVEDARDCSPCACGAPSPPTCSVTTTLFADGACQVALDGAAEGQCVAESGVGGAIVTTAVTGPASCVPSGGAPIGAASVADAVTVCCTH